MRPAKRDVPHVDTTIERIVLGAILHGEGVEALLGLESRDFFDPRHAEIFQVCRDHLEASKPIELPAVGATLADRGQNHLTVQMAECWDEFGGADALDLHHYINRLREYEHLRRLDRELELGRSALVDPELDYDERIEAVATALPAALELRLASKLGTTSALADEALELAERNAAARERGGDSDAISTGIPDLDHAIGGFNPGRLVVFGARTGYGKTTVLSDFALGATSKARAVTYVSLEQPRLEIFLALLHKRSGIPPAEAREGLVDPDRLRRALDEMKPLLLVIESGGFNLRGLATLIRRVRLVQKTQLVVVDYVQLVSNRLPGQTRATEVAGVTGELKRLAVELEICILAAAQLNKGPEEREGGLPQVRDIRESEAVAHDADQVLFLVRPDLRDGRKDPYLSLAKNRHGPTVEQIPLYYDASRNCYRPRALQAVG